MVCIDSGKERRGPLIYTPLIILTEKGLLLANEQGRSSRGNRSASRRALLHYLIFDPMVRNLEPLFEREPRLPAKHFPQTRVVAVPASHTLGLRQIVTFTDRLAGETGDNVDQFID